MRAASKNRVVCFRIEAGKYQFLKSIARRLSAERDEDVIAADLIRAAIDRTYPNEASARENEPAQG